MISDITVRESNASRELPIVCSKASFVIPLLDRGIQIFPSLRVLTKQSQCHRCYAEFISASHVHYCSSKVENFRIIFSPLKGED